MPRLEKHIERILGEAGECLTAAENTLRLNAEFGDSNPYTITEIVACADKMPNLRREGKKYCAWGCMTKSKAITRVSLEEALAIRPRNNQKNRRR